MSGSGSHGAYGNSAWGPPPSGGSAGWGAPPWGDRNSGLGGSDDGRGWRAPHWRGGGPGRVLPIVAMILGFIWFWPIGLAILGYMVWSGRMGCWSVRGGDHARGGYWRAESAAGGGWAGWRGWCNRDAPPAGSGNRAFDEYRAETLRRLEQEQQEFAAFLDRLRFARDKAEFDQFMAERRQAPPPAEQPQAG